MTNGLTSKVLMVRPYQFHKNEETAVNNHYQQDLDKQTEEITKSALEEFDTFVRVLRDSGITVIVHQDTGNHDTPDSIFPNNWVSFHSNGETILYPMYAENRRKERNPEVFKTLQEQHYSTSVVADYSAGEKENIFLEGTGSMILDRVHRIAYAALSDRTNKDLFERFCNEQNFQAVSFYAYQSVGKQRLPIYHTNVMMSVGPTFAVVGLNTVDHLVEREELINSLQYSGKSIIELSETQINQFAGNMLTLEGAKGPLLVMSSAAYQSLDFAQISELEKHAQLIYSPLPTIELCGGGSARCMLAELF